jgi:glycosyltransferase involved in cell wall biosynthesis
MGQTGRELVRQRYAPDAYYQTILSLYERTISAKRGSVRGGLIPTRQAPPWLRPPPKGIRLKAAAPLSVAVITPKLRIAFIGGRGVVSKYSGIEAYYEEVGKRLAQMGHEVTVYCRNYFTPARAEHNGMRVVRLPTIRSKHLETLVHTLLSTAHVLTQRCDIVHYCLPRLLGKKTVVTVQGLDWQRKKWGSLASAVLRLGEQASVHLPNGTMVVSRTLQKRYREEHGIEAFYVPNGGVLRDSRTPDKILEWGLEPGKYILFLGRFSPEKGCHLLVEAYEKLTTDVKLVMAGASSYCDDYSRALRTHASEQIKMLDWVSGETLDELLTNAMLFVLPSDLEGLSLALLDAMGAGLCVLTSDVPENREVVNEAGFTFERGSSADLAERLRFLIANPTVREAAGRAAKARIRELYQWPKIAADIARSYFQVLGRELEQSPAKKPSASVAVTLDSANSGTRKAV